MDKLAESLESLFDKGGAIYDTVLVKGLRKNRYSMADQGKSDQEPSIEEILASIRQIISDDEGGSPAPAAAAPASQTRMDDVIDLVDKVDEPAPPPPPPKAQPAPPPPPRMPEPEPEPVYVPEPPRFQPEPEPEELEETMKNISARMSPGDDAEAIFTDQAASAALGAFHELAARTALERGGSVTLEEITRELLKPMLRAWVDKHVPKMVERLLQQELERISRRVLDE